MNETNGEPHFEAHQNYIYALHSKPCLKMNKNLLQMVDSCKYVIETDACKERMQYFNYLQIVFCELKMDDSLSSTVAIWSLALVAFIVYGLVLLCISINFLMPNLMSIMKYLNLKGHTAGATLLTILVAFPSVLTVIKMCKSPMYVDNIISETMGECFHCLGIVLPMVAVTKMFKISKPQYLRDQAMIVPLFLFFLFLLESKQTPTNISFAFFFIYTSYIFISIVMNFYNIKAKVKSELFKPRAKPGDMIIEIDSEVPIYEINFYNEKISHMYEGKYPIPRIVGVNPTSNAYTNFELVQQFISSFSISSATNMTHYNKLLKYLLFPQFIFINFLIPLVDYNKQNRGWSKLLNCLQLAFCPLSLLAIKGTEMDYFTIVCFVTMAVSIFLFFTTSTHTAPSEIVQIYLALLGVITSDIYYYVVNEEQIALVLQLLEYLTNFTTCGLNYTIFTAGGILQSCVVCVILCKHGNHEMAFGHVLGYIIFQISCVPGLMFFQSCITTQADEIKVQITDSTQTGKIFMTMFVVMSFITILMTNFHLRKSHAFIHFVFYVILNIFMICSELGEIHPFGSNHNIKRTRLKEANFA